MNENEIKEIRQDINGIGKNFNSLNKEFAVCQAEKTKDVNSLNEKVEVLEIGQSQMLAEMQKIQKTINKAMGGLALLIIILQIVIPVAIKFFKIG